MKNKEMSDDITQVLHRLSNIAQIDLESSTLKCFSVLAINRAEMRPSLHFSLSGTSLTGKAALILAEQKTSAWLSPVILLKYLRFAQVVDPGSSLTI